MYSFNIKLKLKKKKEEEELGKETKSSNRGFVLKRN